MSFQQLKQSRNLPNSHFFRFLQVRAFLRTHIPNFERLHRHNTLDCIILHIPGFKGAVSSFYDMLQASVEVSSEKARADWERDLDTEISEDVWDSILGNIHSSSINSRHTLVQFKVVHRLHYSKSRLHAIYPNTLPLCDKCKQETGTLAHQFWFCSKLSSFWSHIFDYL